MSRSDAIIHWLAALAISSAIVAAYLFAVETFTSSFSREMMEITPRVNGVGRFAIGVLKFVGVYALFIFPLTLIPALLVSGSWEMSGRRPSAALYSLGGLFTGFAFATLIIANSTNISERDLILGLGYEDLKLALILGSAGIIGGWVMAWRRREYFNLLHRRQST